MSTLKFSVFGTHPLLPAFLEQSGFSCQVAEMDWAGGWEELSRIALHRSGPDVSSIGTSWLNGLVGMDAVHSFSHEEIDTMGGEGAFVPALWQTTSPYSIPGARVWAIPWLPDVRLIFYWRDMLEQAGIDEKTAFQTPERLEETMERLQASDVETPWGVWTDISYVILHNASTWIWQAGGDFLSADGKRILFDQPEALNGLLAYLRLYRYVPPDFKYVLGRGAHGYELFTSRRVAVAMGPNGWFGGIEQSQDADVLDRLGVAAPPGPAFIGGSNLIIWQHTRHPQDALALVRFLASKQAQLEHCRLTGFLPTRLDVFSEPPYSTEPQYQVMAEALKTGRSYPTIRKWGAIEERLTGALVWLWNDILADPDQDLEAIVEPYIAGVARRLTVTLGTRH